MRKSHKKIFNMLENLDEDENIKQFYKEVLMFELDNKNSHYVETYKKLIDHYTNEVKNVH